MSFLGKAIAIAAAAHQEQIDRNGFPYILHPIRMMLRMDTETEMMAAVLHDIIEDTSWTLEKLESEGIPGEVLDLVERLSRVDNQSYEEFIERIKEDQTAIKIKLADLEDNMDMRRLSGISTEDINRLKRYHHYWSILRKKIQSRT